MLILEIALGVFLGGILLKWANAPEEDADAAMWNAITKEELDRRFGKLPSWWEKFIG